MQVVEIAVDQLKQYKNNPRNNDSAVPYVAESIKNFGFKVPIVIDSNNVIIAGHTRHKAAILLGLEKVPCIVADDLNEEQIKAFRLADNKVSEYATWNDELLGIELESIELDMEMLGFEIGEIEEPEEEEEPEMQFTEVLGEEHNYIVLYFDNEVDWLQAESLIELPRIKELSTRKDGAGTKRVGIGRVLKGADVIRKIQNAD